MKWEPGLRIRVGVLRALAALALAAGAVAAQAADSGTLQLSAVVLSRNQCKFNTESLAIDFGAIDPSSTATYTKSGSISFTCRGSSLFFVWDVSGNNGQHYSSGLAKRQMRHATVTSEFLPYSLSLPASGWAFNSIARTLTVTATIAPVDYQNAIAGSFTDTVQLTLTP
jgi:spore coat protein U-like protein